MNLLVTAPGILVFAGGLIMVAGIIAPIISWAFCTRPAPRWMRQWRDIALAIVGARLLTRDNMTLDIDAWFVSGLWIHLALAQTAIAAWNVLAILPPRSDTCQQERKSGMRVILILFFFVLSLFPLAAGGQDDCPTGFSCVVYDAPDTEDDPVIEIDPKLGPVQSICVEERSERIVGFGEPRRENSVTLAIFMQTTDGYFYERSYTVASEGIYADIQFGDALTLTEVAD